MTVDAFRRLVTLVNTTPEQPIRCEARPWTRAQQGPAEVVPSWGRQAMGGPEALWGCETMARVAHGGLAHGSRLDCKVGYGLAVSSRFVGPPRVGFSASKHRCDYRGHGPEVVDRESLHFELGVDAHRRQNPRLGGPDHGVLGRASVGW